MDKPLKPIKLDEVGEWSELKLEILRKYASAYTRILKNNKLRPVYIDGFAGAGQHIARDTQELILGSPLNALNIEPPFEEFYLVDLKEERVDNLKQLTADKKNVHVYNGDSNSLLLSEVFPKIRYEDYKRGLCVLDPYGLHLNWEVLRKAAESKVLEIFLNFPVMDMNMNVLLWQPDKATPENIQRMNNFWGDESWRNIAYTNKMTLFGPEEEKQSNEVIAAAFRDRLKNVGGFKYVPEPAPMRNSNGAVIYYLYFAAQEPAAANIVTDILNSYRKQGKIRG
ncbi:MAG TPA: three-Cys-motif partner protein TcmP [Candidatus Angelobacter sp.]|jgi:three-Cys-motif partner protein|nr:three-Cys-motif partner protein TcmP [Candidatus Angelobacter sp.]